MRYTSDKNIDNYDNVPPKDLVTPSNYEVLTTYNTNQITKGNRMVGTKGAYYWSNIKNDGDRYRTYFYWACGPEIGQILNDKSLWNPVANEPNNNGSGGAGECCVAASSLNTVQFNDNIVNWSIPGYFLEFSAYDGGLTSGTTYKSTTFYKVSYDANGGSGDVPPFQTKFKDQPMTLAVNSGNLTRSNMGFNGWNTKADGTDTHYDAGEALPADTNEGLTLYAEWVDDPAATPTVIGPKDKTVVYGEISGDLQVEASLPDDAKSNHTLTYQWYASPTDSTTDGTPIDGETQASFTIPTDLNPGKYYYYCKVTSTATDKENRRTSVFSDVGTVTVEKLDSSVTNPPTAKENLAYNDSEQELVYGGAASGGTMQYAIGTDDTTPPTTGWGTTIPKGTDVGPYYVWYKVKGDGNHNDEEPACKTVTIHPKAIKVTAEAKSKNYGEADPPLTYTVDELAPGVTITGSLERDPGENAGTYPIRIGSLATNSANYRIDFTPALLTIHALDATVQKPPTPNELTYTGEAQDLIKPGAANGGTMQYALGTDGITPPTEGWGTEIPAGTDAGTYTVWYRVKGDGSHRDVSPRPINVTILPGEQPAPVDPPEPAKVTSHEITVDAKPDEEYSIDDGKTWVKPKDGEDTVTFGGLDPDKEYAIIARKAGTDNENPSPASAPLVVTTPLGKVETEIILGEGLVGPTVDGFDDAFAKKLNTPKDIKAVDDGATITYTLKVDGLDHPPTGDKAQCEKAAAAIGRGATIGKYFDVSLYKQIGDAEPVKVNDTHGNMVTVSFDIPPELLRFFPNGQREFYVICMNGGKAERIPATISDNRITFLTDKFSIYALAYQDPASQNSANSNNLNHPNGGVNGESTTDTSAKTGVSGSDRLQVALFLIALAAGGALLITLTAFVLKRKKDNQ